MLFSADTETCLLTPAMQAPPLVCLQFAVDDGQPQIIHVKDPACYQTVRYALECGAVWNFHNIAYDAAVIMAQWPDLVPAVFALFDRDLATDTIVRAKLCDIARGRFKTSSKRGYDLAQTAQAFGVGHVVNKDDPHRLEYGTLLGTPVSRWTEGQVKYALDDVIAQRLVYRAITTYAQGKGVPLVDQFRQTRAALWLHLISCRGIRVCPVRAEAYADNVRKLLEVDREVCQGAGLVRHDGTKDTKLAQAYMVRICQETEAEDLPLTETGEAQAKEALNVKELTVGDSWRAYQKLGGKIAVCLNEDACQQFGDETLEAYQRYGTSTTQLARAERLLVAARAGIPIQARFGSLQDTGRTSCSQGDRTKGGAPSALGAQLQNPAKDKKIRRRDGTTFTRKGTRDIFQARPGFVFCSTDYGSMELCGWAQVCLWTVGFSKLAEVLNAGRDPHVELGATIAKISVEDAYAMRKGERGAEKKDWFDNKIRQLAKIANFGFMGGMGYKKLRLQARKQYDVTMTLDEAKALRDAWLATWPEAQLYLRWVSGQLRGPRESQTGDIVQFKSGRARGKCWYSALANTLFQGFCADIAKEAMWRVTREMYTDPNSPLYGGRLVNFLHDEGFAELPEAKAHEAAFRIAEIQIRVGEEWGPGVRWSCEPALMRYWYKSAEAVFDANSRLVPWEPGLKTVKRNGSLMVDTSSPAA